MLAFSTAFALPFTLFAFFPSLLKNLPKSGGWLNSVKVVLGFIEVALGFKFLSVADQTYHWGLLDREVYLAIWIVTFALLGLYLLGKLRFAHDSEMKYLSVPRLGLAIASLTFVMYMIPGMWGAPLKALAGYLPPQTTMDFDTERIVRENVEMGFELYGSNLAPVTKSSTHNTANATCEKPKYGEQLHLPHGIKGYFDYDQALACARAQNKPLFIDFTGHGCVNCREMESVVWADPQVLKRLKKDFVVVALYVDDKKIEVAKEDWKISEFTGKTLKTVGKINADLQLRYNTNAQPYYVLLDNNEKPLVDAKAYDKDINSFVDFLDKGIKEFKKRQ
jgi:thiol:disulfide interchange protein DsbD